MKAWLPRLRLRLVDAVVVAAIALLGLKALNLVAPISPSARGTGEASTGAATGLGFAHALSHARSNYAPPDVAITGTLGEKDAAKDAPAEPLAKGPSPDVPPAAASPSERALLERLGERREELSRRAREADLREKLLENAERKLEARINELKAMEEKAEAAAAKGGNSEAGALKNVVTMYEAMKPKDSARVFDRLPHEVLVPVVLQINPRKMAEILAVMSPESAEKLTVALASRAKGLSVDPRTASTAAALPPGELPAIDAGPAPRR